MPEFRTQEAQEWIQQDTQGEWQFYENEQNWSHSSTNQQVSDSEMPCI